MRSALCSELPMWRPCVGAGLKSSRLSNLGLVKVHASFWCVAVVRNTLVFFFLPSRAACGYASSDGEHIVIIVCKRTVVVSVTPVSSSNN